MCQIMMLLAMAVGGQVTVAIAGVTGAGSPFDLRVQAQQSDPMLTYAYGQLLSGKTGVGYRSAAPPRNS